MTEFSVGMGPRIVSTVKGETRYSLKAIPFGGSCMMVGEDEDDPSPDAFNNKPVGARILVVLGGPMFNLVCAFVLSLFMILGIGINTPVVYNVSPGLGAEAAGIRNGDVIKSIDGHRITTGGDIVLYTLSNELSPEGVTVEYERGGQRNTVTYDPHYESYRLGIAYNAAAVEARITDRPDDHSAAAEAGLRKGDIITEIDGTPIAGGEALYNYFLENPPSGEDLSVTVDETL